jgi:hypothetical protein
MKTVKLPGPARSLGVRLTPLASASGCTPDIEGLFLQDSELNWTATAKEIALQAGNEISFIPIRLVGAICDAPVEWQTEWTYGGGGGEQPVFFGSGPVGVIGYQMSPNYSVWSFVTRQYGVLAVRATCNGHQYGPVTVTFTGGGYYY